MSATVTSEKEDDPSYKRLFSAPELVSDLIVTNDNHKYDKIFIFVPP